MRAAVDEYFSVKTQRGNDGMRFERCRNWRFAC